MSNIGNITLTQGDCLKVLPTLSDKSVDLVLTDLPYGCLNKGNKHAQWDKEIDIDALWVELLRVAKPNAAIVLFGQGLFSAKLMMSQPKLYRYSLVWDKVRTTGFLNVNKMPLRQHGFISDSKDGKRIHPTQKPTELYRWLLDHYANKGDRILDTHLGSGSSAIAAWELGYEFVGIEINETYYNAAKDRLQKHIQSDAAQPRLFDI